MGLVNGGLKVVQVAELGVDALVVLHGVVAAQLALTVLYANLVDGHEPEDVDAQLLEAGEVDLHGLEGTLGGVLAGIHLVDYGALGPAEVVDGWLCALLGLAERGGGEEEREGTCEELFHWMVSFYGCLWETSAVAMELLVDGGLPRVAPWLVRLPFIEKRAPIVWRPLSL